MCILSFFMCILSCYNSCLELKLFPVNLTTPSSLLSLIGFQQSWDKHGLQARFPYI